MPHYTSLLINRGILNFIGGAIRWIYGSIWRTIFNKQKFTFFEYIIGPRKSKDTFDEIGHKMNNRIIAFIFIGLLLSILTI